MFLRVVFVVKKSGVVGSYFVYSVCLVGNPAVADFAPLRFDFVVKITPIPTMVNHETHEGHERIKPSSLLRL